MNNEQNNNIPGGIIFTPPTMPNNETINNLPSTPSTENKTEKSGGSLRLSPLAFYLLHDGRAGITQQQGNDQAQDNANEAGNHPEASSALKFTGQIQPAQG